jgi:hypothetical protein
LIIRGVEYSRAHSQQKLKETRKRNKKEGFEKEYGGRQRDKRDRRKNEREDLSERKGRGLNVYQHCFY